MDRSRSRRGTGRRLRSFFREYTEGLSGRDFRRLLGRDAPQAYAVLTRDQGDGDPGAERGKGPGITRRLQLLFLGLSYKLSPVRRMIFALALVCAVMGLSTRIFDSLDRGGPLLEGSGVLLAVAVLLLMFLLALELVDRVRVRDELEVARQLQRDLLPQATPVLPGYCFAHSYATANEIGGDYYDFVSVPDGRLALVSADASGHGMAAGLLMAIAHATLQTAVRYDPSPRAVADYLNRTLCCTGGNRAFLTFFYALLEPETGRLEYVCAGHPFPMLRRADGEVEELGSGALPLGLRENLEIRPSSAELRPGDLLVLYTDGLPEALDTEGQAFGFDGVRHYLLHPGDADEIHERLSRALRGHVSGSELADDVSLLVVERQAST